MARFDFDDLAQSLVTTRGLRRSSTGSVFGAIDGRPVNIASTVDANGHRFVTVAVATASRAAGEATRVRWAESIDGVRKGQVKVHDEAVSTQFSHKRTADYGNAEFASIVDRLVAAAAAEGAVNPTSASSRPGLVNGFPRWLTEAEAGQLAASGRQASSEYENRRPKIANGLVYGLAGMVASAIGWAAVAVILDRQFWMAAIAAGVFIGFMVLRGTEKTNIGVQILIGALTVAAVILGQILTVAWVLNDELGIVDAGLVFDLYKESISVDPGSFAFALGGGLLGGFYGARMAGKPAIEPQIDMIPADAAKRQV